MQHHYDWMNKYHEALMFNYLQQQQQQYISYNTLRFVASLHSSARCEQIPLMLMPPKLSSLSPKQSFARNYAYCEYLLGKYLDRISTILRQIRVQNESVQLIIPVSGASSLGARPVTGARQTDSTDGTPSSAHQLRVQGRHHYASGLTCQQAHTMSGGSKS